MDLQGEGPQTAELSWLDGEQASKSGHNKRGQLPQRQQLTPGEVPGDVARAEPHSQHALHLLHVASFKRVGWH